MNKLDMFYYAREILASLQEDIQDNVLDLNENIQVLRFSECEIGEYRPVLDWFYSDDVMRSIVEIDLFDEPYEINEKHSLKEDYEKHKSLLEIITVQECIYELISFCNSLGFNGNSIDYFAG